MYSTILDKSRFENTGLDEPDIETYHCPQCGYTREVIVEYDLFSKLFFPVSIKDAICPKCEIEMDKK